MADTTEKLKPIYGFCYQPHIKAKIKFLNRQEADQFILDNNYNLRSYYCDKCSYFHLTSSTSSSLDKLIAPAVKVRKRKKPRRLL